MRLPWNRKSRKEITELKDDVVKLKAETDAVIADRPRVDRLVRQLHKQLEDNNFDQRLYLQILQSRR